MSTRAQLSETINRLLPGEQYKRIREAILAAANYSGQRTDQLRQAIDTSNRLRTGLLISGTTEILTDTSAELSGFVWVIDFAVKQPTGVSALVIDAPEADVVREDYFLGLSDGTIAYRAGTVDILGNSFPPIYDPASEVILKPVRRNPDGTNEEVEIPEGSNLIDFAEQNIIPYIAAGKFKNSQIQVIFDALGIISGYKFPVPVKGSPAINDDEFITKAQLPSIPQYGLLNGGAIQYRGDGLWFKWAPAVVGIGGVLTAPFAEIALDTAEATEYREDLLGWLKVNDTTATPHVIKGTPGPAFAPPPYDPTVFVVGIPVKIPPAATVPDGSFTTENVYLENTEWTVSKSGTGTLDSDSTDNPKSGTKAVKSTGTAANYRVRFTRGTTLDISTLTNATIGGDLSLIAAMANNQSVAVVFLDAAGNPASNQLFLQLNKALTSYQFFALALAQFNFQTTEIKHVEFIWGMKGGGTFAGFYLDNIKIQGGVEQPSPPGASGDKGWSPVLAVVSDGERRVHQVIDWTGGQGAKPATGLYIGIDGLKVNVADGVDIRGAAGADGVDGGPGADGADGSDGTDGREVEIQNTGTYIQWRYVGDVSWTNLIAVADITGADGADGTDGTDGREIELQVNGSDMLQWRYVGDPGWTDLFDLTTLSGGGTDPDAVHYSVADGKSASEKQQANTNLGLITGSPVSISLGSNQTNWNIGNGNYFKITTTSRSIQGIVSSGRFDGELIVIQMDSGTLTLAHESGSATAENRIQTPTGASYVTSTGEALLLRYNGTMSRWQFITPFVRSSGAQTKTGIMTFSDAVYFDGVGSTDVGSPANRFRSIPGRWTAGVYDSTNLLVTLSIKGDGSIAAKAAGLPASGIVPSDALWFDASTGTLQHQRSDGSTKSIRRDEQALLYQLSVTTAGSINNQALTIGNFNYRFTAATEITGIANGELGIVLIIQNENTADLTLKHESGSSIAANRLLLPGAADLVISAKGKVGLIYSSASRWELLFSNTPGSGGGGGGVSLPAGGDPNHVLKKLSSADGDVYWGTDDTGIAGDAAASNAGSRLYLFNNY